MSLARSKGSAEVLEPLWYYAGRDWGFIGHMAILVANSCRLLETIGWQHAEHVLRYVVQGLAGWGKEHAEHADVRPYWANLRRVENAAGRLPGDWAEGRGNEGLTKDLLALLRDGKGDEACDLAVKRLTEGKARAGADADAYLKHPVLRPRLVEIWEAVLCVDGRSAHDIFGSPDDIKPRSCATLFAAVSPPGSAFERVLQEYFRGEPDGQTLRLLEHKSETP